MQNFSYHTHTVFSDGHNTIEEMLDRAEELGWREIGISDHLIVHKNITRSRSFPRWMNSPNNHVYRTGFVAAAEDFARHAENVRRAARGRRLKVKVGAEVDWFVYDGWEEEFAAFRKESGLDYYISGNHFLQPSEGEILDIKDLSLLAGPEREKALKNHFAAICRAIESGVFAFIAHVDYIRKSEFCPDEAFWQEKMKVVDCLEKCKTATELSSKGLRKRGDFYPADKLIREIVRRQIPLVGQRQTPTERAELGLNLPKPKNICGNSAAAAAGSFSFFADKLVREIVCRQIPLVVSDNAHRTGELGFEFAKSEEYLRELDCRRPLAVLIFLLSLSAFLRFRPVLPVREISLR